MLKIKELSFIKLSILFLLVTINIVIFSYIGFLFYFQGKIFPGIKIASISLSRQTPASSQNLLSSLSQKRIAEPLKVTYKKQDLSIDIAAAQPNINLDENIQQAYTIGRSGDYLKDFGAQLQALTQGVNLTPKLTYQKLSSLLFQINRINQTIKQEPIDAQIVFGQNITINPAQEGLELDDQTLVKQIEDYLTFAGPKPTTLPLKTTQAKFTTTDAENAKLALEYVKDAPLTLSFENQNWTIDQPTLFSLLDTTGTSLIITPTPQAATDAIVGKNLIPDKKLLINEAKLSQYLKNLSDKIDQEAKDARFTFNPVTRKVQEFQAAQEGRRLDIKQTAKLLTEALINRSDKNITLPVKITQPKIMTADVNTFGIKTLLGKGISNFTGSIPNRIYNIELAASRINGTLVGPDKTFSFNKTVGDISAASGYRQAYVIKSGRTVLDDGGGVCQVSTTLFRAVLNAGLPIVERTAHAYRVSYYEQGFPPGLDATIFSPTVDFKFKNDTSAYILIQAYRTGTTLAFDIYGTDDGRVASLTTSKITNQTPPPPELRQDDPTLPKGEVKQVDWPAWGATVSFSRTVTRGNETIIQETWKSFYKPWQAVYLVGTKE